MEREREREGRYVEKNKRGREREGIKGNKRESRKY
jgi:hypothetical protein